MTINPDTLCDADLSAGIPVPLWNGANQAARDLLLAEHQRQRAHAARQCEAADSERQESLRRIIRRPQSPSPTVHLRRLLLETAAAAHALAMTLPADDGPSPDADASRLKE